MASLKELRTRINAVKNTRKITSAMKMVAASRLRRAQDAAAAARPYVEGMERMAGDLAAAIEGAAGAPELLVGNGASTVHLLVVMTAERGLCGGFNGNVARSARRMIAELEGQGKQAKALFVGAKGRAAMGRELGDRVVGRYERSHNGADFACADAVTHDILTMFERGDFDVCTIIYNRFKSVIAQIVTRRRLVPFTASDSAGAASPAATALCDYEPSAEEMLRELLPKALSAQIFAAMLESDASEQGARMNAMDSATRNAGEMIDRLTLAFNRTRQATITRELIEIISGAEAL